MGHPKVAEAAVVGVVHPKWGERPLLVVARSLAPLCVVPLPLSESYPRLSPRRTYEHNRRHT